MSTLIALLTLVNPVAAAPAFLALTQRMAPERRLRTAAATAVSVAAVIAGTACVGGAALQILGLELPALRVTGGGVLLIQALRLVLGMGGATTVSWGLDADDAADHSVAIVPLAVPVLVGPGTVAMVVSAMPPGHSVAAAALWSVYASVVGLAVFAVLALAQRIETSVPRSALDLSTRLAGLVLATIAVGVLAEGLRGLFPGSAHAVRQLPN